MDNERLEKIEKMVEENNELLKKIRGVQKRLWWISFLKTVVIIALAFGAYYLIQPYVDNINYAYDSLLGTIQNIQETKTHINGIFHSN